MFNLLPEIEKQAVKAEYGRRRLIAALGFLFATLAVAFLFLVPSLLISRYRLGEATHAAAALQGSDAIARETELNSELSAADSKIDALRAGESWRVTDALASIIAARTPSIRLTSFEFDRVGTTTQAIVKGVASDRTSLLEFHDALKQNSVYGSVDLPISNFTKDVNIDFTINISER